MYISIGKNSQRHAFKSVFFMVKKRKNTCISMIKPNLVNRQLEIRRKKTMKRHEQKKTEQMNNNNHIN